MRKVIYLTSMIGLVLMSACSSDKVSFETQEQSRKQALENATYNAKTWRDANYPDAKILMRGDSTISATCAQGDGWATVDLKDTQDAFTELKCSTVSDTIGCLLTGDFKRRSQLSKQDGSCNRELPFPLPKIVQ